MKAFSQLYKKVKSSVSPHRKKEVLKQFFSVEKEEECAAALALFFGYKPPGCVTGSQLSEWACEFAEIPGWLFLESQAITNSEMEAVNLMLPRPEVIQERSLSELLQEIRKLKKLDLEDRKAMIWRIWRQMHPMQRPLFHAWITGGFRGEISSGILHTALAEIFNVHPFQVACCLYGQKIQDTSDWKEIFKELYTQSVPNPVEFSVVPRIQSFGEMDFPETDWRAFKMWKGLPVQLIYAKGRWWIWSESARALNEQMPEIETAAEALPKECIWGGEIISICGEKVIPYTEWKSRVERKKNTRQQVAEFPLYFLLHPRHIPDVSFSSSVLMPEEIQAAGRNDQTIWVAGESEWKDAGILFQQISRTDNFLYWELVPVPVRIFAVLMHVELTAAISGKMTPEFSFGVWNMHNTLVPVAKTHLGISAREQKELLDFVKKNTVEKRGPVRVVQPELVFEIEVAGFRKNTRKKSGIEALSPVILRWNRDILAIQAMRLHELQRFL